MIASCCTVDKIAYIMSRFPKLTETFVLYEIVELERLGVAVELFPLLRQRDQTTQPEAMELVRRAHFLPFMSFRIIAAQWYFIRRKPRAYVRALAEVLKGTFGSSNFFIGAIGIFPKTVCFAREIQRLGVTHVHAHFATHPTVAALIINRLIGLPYSFTAHGSDLHVDRRMLDKKVNAASFAITVSSYNKEVMVKKCGEMSRAKIHVIRCGIDTGFWNQELGHSAGQVFTIVCVGSFEEVKGHRFLLKACKILGERKVSFFCHLVGEGPLRQQVEAQIRKCGLGERVKLHGGVPRPKVRDICAAADVFVLASVPTNDGKREGIPVALMEAMACGLPVVASDLSGIPELVKDGQHGFLVRPTDSRGLADAIEELYQYPERRSEMGKRARKKVVTEFSLAANVRKRLELYQANAQLAPDTSASLVGEPAVPERT